MQAVKYDQWLQAQRLTDAGSRYAGLAQNGWAELVGVKLQEATRHGPACFDRTFYVASNRFDLGHIEVKLSASFAALGGGLSIKSQALL